VAKNMGQKPSFWFLFLTFQKKHNLLPNFSEKAQFALSGQTLFVGHNSAADRARELFKPCND